MDITNKPGPTSKRKTKLSFHFGYKFINTVTIILVILSKTSAQSFSDLHCEKGKLLCTGEKFEFPYPICVNSTCICRKGSCVHYTTVNDDYHNYYCGECGTIGSTCINGVVCQNPGECYAGFCQCPAGYLVDDICLRFEPISTSTWSIVLISILVFLLILNKIIVSYEGIKNLFLNIVRCRYCRRSQEDPEEDVAYGYNTEGQDKSPAYTISSRDFISTSNDPDLEWALELSAQLARNGAERRRSLTNSFRLTRRNARYWRQRQLEVNSPNSSTRSNRSSLSSSSTPSSSRNSTLYGTSRATPRSSERRRGYYSLFRENETRGDEVILTRILNHLSRRTSESSAVLTETAFHSSTSTTDSQGTTSSTSPASIKRFSLSEETSEKPEECSTSSGEVESFGRSKNSDSDFESATSTL